MNPLTLAPEAIYLTFVLVLVAAFLGSVVLILISVICIALIFWYTRGPENAATAAASDVDIISPSDGVVTNVYCDIQRMTHIEIEQSWTDRHVIYAVFGGEVVDNNDRRIIIQSHIGRIVYDMSGKTKSFVEKGDVVAKGDAIAYAPYETTVAVVLPVYQSSINLTRNQPTKAGDIIGRVDQVWSL
jgi:hypothetical protein